MSKISTEESRDKGLAVVRDCLLGQSQLTKAGHGRENDSTGFLPRNSQNPRGMHGPRVIPSPVHLGAQ